MAILSYLPLAQGFSLMVNRSGEAAWPRVESLTQASVAGDGGMALRVLYPVDPRSGGTWAGVNDRGAAFALRGDAGALVPEALRAATAGGGLERVAAMDLSGLGPFQLLGLEEGHAPLSLLWDGQSLERRLHPDGSLLLGAGTLPSQGEVLKDEAALLAAQEAFHLENFAPALSFTQVLVLPKLIVLRYWDQAAMAAGQEAELISMQKAVLS